GNLPYKSEIAPLLIVIRLEEYNYAAATAIAAIMLVLSFLMLLIVNLAQSWSRKRYR
ncbi:molybdate ABC transporter permease subunit, partial [Mesorhizobium sp. M0195]